MPLKKDPKFKTLDLKEDIPEYCSFCFENGSFKNPNISLKEMQKLAIAKMKSFGIPTVFAWFFSRKIAKLKRWKK